VVSAPRLGEPGDWAQQPAVAYNAVADEFLVAWTGSNTAEMGESEVFVRRVDGSGRPIGATSQVISQMGPPGVPSSASWRAEDVSVGHNPDTGEYLVVWNGTDDRPTDRWRCDLYAQRLDRRGRQIGADDFPVSQHDEPGSDTCAPARTPDVVYNEGKGEYFVVWFHERPWDPGGRYPWGQRVSSHGREIGPDIRLAREPNQGFHPTVALNPARREYLVAWTDPNTIRAQRVSENGRLLGPTSDRLTDVASATRPDLAFDAARGQYVLAFEQWSDVDPYSPDEVHAQLLDAAGARRFDTVRISSTPYGQSPDEYPTSIVRPMNAALGYDSRRGSFLVTWQGNGAEPPLEYHHQVQSRVITAP
jgi:hypothetical protein